MSECMSTQPSIPTKRVGLLCRTVERGKSMWRAPQDYWSKKSAAPDIWWDKLTINWCSTYFFQYALCKLSFFGNSAMSRFSPHGFIADPEIDSEIMLLPKRYMIHLYLCHMYIYGWALYIRFRVRGNFPVYFSSTCFFSQRNPRTATRSGPFTASCVSEMQLEFFPQGPPKQVFTPPWTGGQVSFGGRENSQPGFCALFLWAPGNVRLKCARNRLCTKFWRIFFHSKLWKFFWCPTFEKFDNTAPGD